MEHKFNTQINQSGRLMKEFVDTVISFYQNIKQLYEKEHLEIGRDRLFKFLREHKVLQENNVPYQSYMERNWFDVIEYTLYHSGEAAVYPSTRITPKGQAGILKMLRKFYVKSK